MIGNKADNLPDRHRQKLGRTSNRRPLPDIQRQHDQKREEANDRGVDLSREQHQDVRSGRGET